MLLMSIQSNIPAFDEIHFHEENISDVQDALFESSTPIPHDIDVSEDDISDFEHVLVESSMTVSVTRYTCHTYDRRRN